MSNLFIVILVAFISMLSGCSISTTQVDSKSIYLKNYEIVFEKTFSCKFIRDSVCFIGDKTEEREFVTVLEIFRNIQADPNRPYSVFQYENQPVLFIKAISRDENSAEQKFEITAGNIVRAKTSYEAYIGEVLKFTLKIFDGGKYHLSEPELTFVEPGY